jgi:drug/metabolite transporter (DMT)-like permease
MESKRSLPLIILSYLMIYFIWGSTYLFIAFAVESIPAPWIIALRFLSSGILFVLIPVLGGQVRSFPTGREILSACFLGLFLLILGNGIITWAEMTVDSHLAALMISTVPLVVALYSIFLYKSRLSGWQIGGMASGLAGVVLLLFRGGGEGIRLTPGIILVIIATLCWGFGTAFSRKLKPHANIMMHTGMQMLFAGLLAWPAAVFTTGSPLPPLTGIPPLAWFSVVYLAFIGGSAIIGYNYLLKHEPTTRITTYAFVNPLVATLLGLFVRGEHGGPLLVPGMALVLLGLFLILYLGRAREKKAP